MSERIGNAVFLQPKRVREPIDSASVTVRVVPACRERWHDLGHWRGPDQVGPVVERIACVTTSEIGYWQ